MNWTAFSTQENTWCQMRRHWRGLKNDETALFLLWRNWLDDTMSQHQQYNVFSNSRHAFPWILRAIVNVSASDLYNLFYSKIFVKVFSRSCTVCGIYFSLKKAFKLHQKIHVLGGIRGWVESRPFSPDVDTNSKENMDEFRIDAINDKDRIPLITGILQFMESPLDDEIDIQTQE